MIYNFIDAGSTAKEQLNTLYLDVGNNLRKGIVDHHQLIDIQKSATRLVYENPKFISNKIDTITLHKSPDLDCIASSYLSDYYIKNNYFPKFSEKLCKFIDRVDFGLSTKNIINLASIFSLIKNECKDDNEIVKKGHELIKDFAKYDFDSENYPIKYYKYASQLQDDLSIFKNDLEHSNTILSTLYNRFLNIPETVQGLILFKPESKLFKYWARDSGYDLLIVKWSNQRVVISLKGDSSFTLKGIGDTLNKLEQLERDKLNIFINEPNRVGYDIPDPWYDGRAHNYTIIDSPRSGTILKFDDILDNIF